MCVVASEEELIVLARDEITTNLYTLTISSPMLELTAQISTYWISVTIDILRKEFKVPELHPIVLRQSEFYPETTSVARNFQFAIKRLKPSMAYNYDSGHWGLEASSNRGNLRFALCVVAGGGPPPQTYVAISS